MTDVEATPSATRPVVGKTRWRRFWLVLAPSYAAVAGIIYLIASGSLAVSFAISNAPFIVAADSLTSGSVDGNQMGFYQFGVANFHGDGSLAPSVESIIPDATLNNLCQSITVPGTPITLVTRAGTDPAHPVRAANLVTDATSLTATNASFNDIRIGQDMSTFANPALSQPVGRGSGPNVQTGPVAPGTFGQTARTVTLTGLHQNANGTSASTFTLPNLSLAFGAPCT